MIGRMKRQNVVDTSVYSWVFWKTWFENKGVAQTWGLKFNLRNPTCNTTENRSLCLIT